MVVEGLQNAAILPPLVLWSCGEDEREGWTRQKEHKTVELVFLAPVDILQSHLPEKDLRKGKPQTVLIIYRDMSLFKTTAMTYSFLDLVPNN